MNRTAILNNHLNKFEFLENVVITEEVIEILLNLPEQYSKLVAAIKSLLADQEIPINPEMYSKIGEQLYGHYMDFWDPPHSFSVIMVPFMLAITQSDLVKYTHRLAELYRECEESEHSIYLLEKILSKRTHLTQHISSYQLLGEILLDQDDYTHGTNMLNNVLVVDPDNVRCNFLLGDYYRKKYDFISSEMHLIKTVGKKDGITWGDMVEFYQEIDNEEKTLDAFENILKIDGTAFNKLQFAKYLIEIGRNEQAVLLLRSIVSMGLYHELEKEVMGLLDKFK